LIEEAHKFEQPYNYVKFTKPTPLPQQSELEVAAPLQAQPQEQAPIMEEEKQPDTVPSQQDKPYIAPLALPNSRGLKHNAEAPPPPSQYAQTFAKHQYTKIVPSQAHYELHPELSALEPKQRAYRPKLLDLNQPSKDKPAYCLPRRFTDSSKFLKYAYLPPFRSY
jgi:hypothetical protein